MVDFPVFDAAYWRPTSIRLRGGLEPDLVFAEIMGVIKGTTSLLSEFRPLSRDEYRSMSSRLAPTFAAENMRDRIYDIFEAYESKKKQRGDHDAIDRVKNVLIQLTGNTVFRRRLEGLFEEVYVDGMLLECLSFEFMVTNICFQCRGTGPTAFGNRIASKSG